MENNRWEKRKKELKECICESEEEKTIYEPVTEEMVFLEKQLEELRTMPFIRTHPDNPSIQRSTPAQKQYKELLQQYTNIVKILERKKNGTEGNDSPLFRWIKEHEHTK